MRDLSYNLLELMFSCRLTSNAISSLSSFVSQRFTIIQISYSAVVYLSETYSPHLSPKQQWFHFRYLHFWAYVQLTISTDNEGYTVFWMSINENKNCSSEKTLCCPNFKWNEKNSTCIRKYLIFKAMYYYILMNI